MSIKLGDTIDGKYKIVRLLGEGGMGAVYEGENLRIHRKVAIKILHSNIAQSKDAVQRFEREAQAAGRIGSDHIVEVLDLGELQGGDRYMVMEFLEGESLADRIGKTGGLPPHKTASIMIGMLEGLTAAHNAGIVHRDLKPDNVFLLANRGGKPDFVKIVDFGISKFSTLGGEFSMTQTGAVMGTPYYLSPEQAKGERNVDALSDLYAAGVILWETVAGKVPFDGDTFNELLFKIVLEPVPDLATMKPGLDPHFVSIVHKAMARDRQLRFQSASEMQQALSNWLDGHPPSSEVLADGDAARITRPRISATDISLESTTTGTTGGNWTNTSAQTRRGGTHKKWWIAGALGVVLAGGSGMLLSHRRETAEATARAQARQEQELARDAERKRKAELTRLESERMRVETERAQAERSRQEALRRQTEAQLAASRAPAPEKPAPAPRLRPIPPRVAPAPTPAPAARPAPTSAGRTIRTDL